MSYLNTKHALVTQLLTVVNQSDVDLGNKNFDPQGKESWYAVYLNSSTSESTGKTLDSSEQRFGFFQVSVFTSQNMSNWDNLLLEKVDLVQSAFKNTSSVSYGGQVVDILETDVTDPRKDDSWYRKDMTINYLTFSER
jgi:hypothetical protein